MKLTASQSPQNEFATLPQAYHAFCYMPMGTLWVKIQGYMLGSKLEKKMETMGIIVHNGKENGN